MSAAIKRRKVTAPASRNASTKPKGLDVFTRVSKAGSAGKVIIEKNNYVDSVVTTQLEEYATTKGKRKVILEEKGSATITSAIGERIIKPLPQRRTHNTPSKPITNPVSQSTASTTKSTRNLLDHLFISSKASAPEPELKVASTPSPPSTQPQELPIELLDLIDLHAAFLTALSLHYAHNGFSSPADLRLLCPAVARAWGKRAVHLSDIKRTLGVLNAHIPSDKKHDTIARLSLADYGHGKICIEIEDPEGSGTRLLDEDLLNGIFVRGIKTAWEKTDDGKVETFIASLPMEDISSSVLDKISPMLAKGQRRLEDLRKGITMKKDEKKKTPVVEVDEVGGAKKLTLLERLRAKALHQSTLPPPPSKAHLSRKAALQRVEEVAGVLSILSTSSSVGQQRISFTFPTVLGKLRDSFKNPMSKAEGDMCMRLLACEVAPNWVRIVKMGKVEAVVVNRDERPSEGGIRERVLQCLET